MSEDLNDIVSIGECMVELYSNSPIDITTNFEKTLGGDAFNLLSMAQRLGSKAGFVTKLGNDTFASFLKKSFLDRKINIDSVVSCDGYTGIYFVILADHGERQFIYYRSKSAASRLTTQDLDSSYLRNTKILHASGITQAISKSSSLAVTQAFAIGKDIGVTISYDPNIRTKLCSLRTARNNFQKVAGYIDILLPSQEELLALNRTKSLSKAIDQTINLGIKTIVIKKGSNGCELIHQGHSTCYPSMKGLDISDTTGAGDAFNGAFLHGIAQGMNPINSSQLAVIASSLKCRKRGAVDSQPSKNEVYGHYMSQVT